MIDATKLSDLCMMQADRIMWRMFGIAPRFGHPVFSRARLLSTTMFTDP